MKSCQINLSTVSSCGFWSMTLYVFTAYCYVPYLPSTMGYFAHHTTKRVDNIIDVWRGTPSSPFFPHFFWTAMPRTVQNKTTYALIHKALLSICYHLPSSHSFFVSKYIQDALPSVYAEHTTLTSRHLIFVIWQNFAIQKSVFKDRKKNLGSQKSYEEAQQVGLFYSTAFFIKTNAKFSPTIYFASSSCAS